MPRKRTVPLTTGGERRSEQVFKFTQARVRDLPPAPPGRRLTYWHTDPPQLALRVTDTGRRAFYVVKRVGRRVDWVRLDPNWPTCSVDEAVLQAHDLLGTVARGRNPAAERRGTLAAAVRLREFLARFLDDYAAANCAKGSLVNWEILCRRHVARQTPGPKDKNRWRRPGGSEFGDVPLAAVDREWVARLQRIIAPKPGDPRRRTANAAVAMLRRAFTVAADVWGWNLPHGNPAAAVPLFRDAERDALRVRYLTADELRRLFKALPEASPDARLAVLMALLTGQRRGNVLGARWDGLDLENNLWTVRHAPRIGASTKARHDHHVALPRLLVEQLRARRRTMPRATWVFPAPTKSGHATDIKKEWQAIVARAELCDFRFHDLRHSAATLMLAAGTPLPVIGAQLGHRSSESTARYSHVQVDGQRAAVAAIADALPAVVLERAEDAAE